MDLKELEVKWLSVWKRRPEQWDTLDDIERDIAAITGETDVEVSQRLYEKQRSL